MEIEKLIENHTLSIEKGNRTPPRICAVCGKYPDSFRFYDIRDRRLRLLRLNLVKVILTFLLRWKCPLCRAKFTDYPPFIAPHKRFIVHDMITCCQNYLTHDGLSYAGSAATENGDDICYPDDNNFCEQFFAKSTVWRFMGYLAKLPDHKELSAGFQSTVKTIKTPSISSSNYRSQNRLFLLQKAFTVIQTWIRVIFPDFETAGPPI